MSITLVGESVTTYSNDLSLKGFIRNKKFLKPLGVTHTSLLVEKCGEFQRSLETFAPSSYMDGRKWSVVECSIKFMRTLVHSMYIAFVQGSLENSRDVKTFVNLVLVIKKSCKKTFDFDLVLKYVYIYILYLKLWFFS